MNPYEPDSEAAAIKAIGEDVLSSARSPMEKAAVS